MAQPNLDQMSIAELKQLQNDTQKAIDGFEARKRAEALAELEQVAQKHGFKLSELVGSKKAVKPSGPAKYRHPENASLTWTGRSLSPLFICHDATSRHCKNAGSGMCLWPFNSRAGPGRSRP